MPVQSLAPDLFEFGLGLGGKHLPQNGAELAGGSRAFQLIVGHLGRLIVVAHQLELFARFRAIAQFYLQLVLPPPILFSWRSHRARDDLRDDKVRQIVHKFRGVVTRLIEQG
jgi:hypothetical protein